MELEEAIKELKTEIENFENDLKALEKTDIDVEYKIQIVHELAKYILVRQTILTHLTKQDKMIDIIIKHICDVIDNDDGACLLPFYNSDENLEEKVKQYFEKKVEE